MRIALYTIWFLLPLFFFSLALWGKLESAGGKSKNQGYGDFFRQGLFVLFCVFVSILIDYYLLEKVVNAILGDVLPYGFYQVLLLPIVLLLAAKLIGPSDAIKIANAPRPVRNRKRR